MEDADHPSTDVRIVRLQFVDTVQMAVADISTLRQRHNHSNDRWTTCLQDIPGLARDNAVVSAGTEIEKVDRCPAKLETVEEAARKKRAVVEHKCDGESEALPEDKKSDLLACVAPAQGERLNPLVTMQAGRSLSTRLI